MMSRVLAVTALLFFACGAIAAAQLSNGVDHLLLIVPANLLPISRPFIAGPDLPGHLTYEGIGVVYLLPSLILGIGAFLLRRKT